MGAWIETIRYMVMDPISRVAPYMGAWIETEYRQTVRLRQFRRSLYGSVD